MGWENQFYICGKKPDEIQAVNTEFTYLSELQPYGKEKSDVIPSDYMKMKLQGNLYE